MSGVQAGVGGTIGPVVPTAYVFLNARRRHFRHEKGDLAAVSEAEDIVALQHGERPTVDDLDCPIHTRKAAGPRRRRKAIAHRRYLLLAIEDSARAGERWFCHREWPPIVRRRPQPNGTGRPLIAPAAAPRSVAYNLQRRGGRRPALRRCERRDTRRFRSSAQVRALPGAPEGISTRDGRANNRAHRGNIRILSTVPVRCSPARSSACQPPRFERSGGVSSG